MSVKMINRWGNLAVYTMNETVIIESVRSKIKYKQVYRQYQTINHRYLREKLGWRVSISFEIFNTNDAEAAEMKKLVRMINSGDVLNIIPAQTDSIDDLVFIDCLLESGLNFMDISKCRVGQSLVLSFVTRGLLAEIPTLLD